MSAQDYFRSDTPGRQDASRPNPASPDGGPYQTPFPPAHTGYNDDLSYAPTHYSKHSIDDTYDSPYNNSNSSPQKSPYTESIPLQDRPSAGSSTAYMGAAAAESGRPYSTHPLGDPNLTTRVRRARPKKRRPWLVYTLSAIQVIVFCWQLGRQAQLTGSPIETKPRFNPMIGPSFGGLVNMGARYSPCMKEVKDLSRDDRPSITFDDRLTWPCPKDPGKNTCSLRELCGFNGNNMPAIEATGDTSGRSPVWRFPDGKTAPNQWYRFLIPIFLHAGLIHLVFNMFAQIGLGGEIERQVGMLRFGLIYLVSGIFSFVFSGTLSGQAQATVGASGSLFGIFALTLLNILYHWRELPSPLRDLLWLLVDIVISFVLGLLPYIDNFAHIGGFISGLALGVVFLRSPAALQKRLDSTATNPPYTAATASNPYNTSTGDANLSGFTGFVKQPLGFFKGRKPLWWAWWLVRAAMLAAILGAFVGLLNNFYVKERVCSWCKYLSCLPVRDWCDMADLKFETQTSPARMFARSLG